MRLAQEVAALDRDAAAGRWGEGKACSIGGTVRGQGWVAGFGGVQHAQHALSQLGSACLPGKAGSPGKAAREQGQSSWRACSAACRRQLQGGGGTCGSEGRALTQEVCARRPLQARGRQAGGRAELCWQAGPGQGLCGPSPAPAYLVSPNLGWACAVGPRGLGKGGVARVRQRWGAGTWGTAAVHAM